jgi:hypothetical protein
MSVPRPPRRRAQRVPGPWPRGGACRGWRPWAGSRSAGATCWDGVRSEWNGRLGWVVGRQSKRGCDLLGWRWSGLLGWLVMGGEKRETARWMDSRTDRQTDGDTNSHPFPHIQGTTDSLAHAYHMRMYE